MTTSKEELNKLFRHVLDASITVHKQMGPGLLESVYSACLISELRSRDIGVQCEVFLPLYYKGQELNKDFRLDLLLEDEIILEIKAVEVLLPVHEAQIISYLKLADKRLGFLINFNVPLLKNGFRHFVNNF